MEYNIRSDAIRCEISTTTKVIVRICMLALIVSEISTFKNVDLESFGQGQGVQHAHWRYLMANINVYDSHSPRLFCAKSHRFQDISILNVVTMKK